MERRGKEDRRGERGQSCQILFKEDNRTILGSHCVLKIKPVAILVMASSRVK